MSDTETPPPGEPAAPSPFDVKPISLTDELKRSYLDYAMSVIVARALAGRARRFETGTSPHSILDE